MSGLKVKGNRQQSIDVFCANTGRIPILDNWEADFEPGSIENSKLTMFSMNSGSYRKSTGRNQSSKLIVNPVYVDDEESWERDVEIDEEKMAQATPTLSKRMNNSKFLEETSHIQTYCRKFVIRKDLRIFLMYIFLRIQPFGPKNLQ